ncbi:MAG: hypothetical protein IAF94_13790 [Pirellulaceae bacterium]|nr:hypothetical protein [Pirellulaceae bacterium]
MAQPETIEEAIEQNALGPASVTVAGQTVVQKDIAQQIKADEYLAAKQAAAKPQFGLRFTKIIPPGAG